MDKAVQEFCARIAERFGEGPSVAAGVLAVSIVIGLLLHHVVLRGLAALFSKTKTDLDERILRTLRWPVIASVTLAGAYVAVYQLGASEATTDGAGHVLLTIAVLVWAVLGLRMARLVVQHASHVANRFPLVDRRTAPLFGNLAAVLVIALGIYLLLLIWGVNPMGWLASASVLGVVLGLAAKDSLSNLFAGVFIVADAPYQIGDYIVLDDGVRGEVVHIGLRSTRVQTRDDVHITIPNSVIGMSKIVNQSGGGDTAMRVRIPVGVGYDSDVDLVKRVLSEIAVEAPGVCVDPAPCVRFRRLGDSALEFELLVWVSDPSLRGTTTDAVLTEIVKRFRAEQIDIPFPQRTVHLVSQDN